MTGKCSEFGGAWDRGMARTEGLSIYEHWEADKRPDLFYPRSQTNLALGTSQRLISAALFLAFRHPTPANGEIRQQLQGSKYRVTNAAGVSCVASLVDWGPSPDTGREFDLSRGVFAVLGLSTDDTVQVDLIA